MKRVIAAVMAAVTIIAGGETTKTGGIEDANIELPIVMYHQLSTKSRMLNDYVLSTEQFENDLRYLRDNGYETVTVTQLVDWYEGQGILPAKPVMITFDDGYETTKAYAEPLLRQYGFTAVVAVIATVADLFSSKPDHTLEYSYLNWDDIREMSLGDVFEIQCHTYNMHKLSIRRGCGKMRGEDSDIYRDRLCNDLSKFERSCVDNGVATCGSIAFPYGFYCGDTIDIVKEMGYKAAFTCTQKMNSLSGDKDELFELCRFNRPTGKSSEAFFAKWKLS